MSENSGKTTRLDWVLRYIRLGWPVIPLRGKLPLTQHGSKDATLSEKQARAWWQQWPDANIGVATGHRFFVLDMDIKNGGEESLEYLIQQHGRFPDTAEQITGTGGKHLLFAMPDFPVKNSANVIASGLDIRGVGGYIVVSPSIHPDTGRHYLWDGLKDLEQQPIPQAPAWLIEKLRGDFNKPNTPKAQPMVNALNEGERNTRIFKLACSLRRKGLSAEEILATIKVVNEQRCKPPLPLDELRTIANSSARYAPDERGNVFASAPAAAPPPTGAPDPAEVPLSASDVEAAIDDAIARDSLVDATRLAVEVAKLRPMIQAVLAAKVLAHFKRDARLFEKALRDAQAGDGQGQKPPDAPPPADGDGNIEGPDLRYFPLTDAGNGERIVAMYGERVRFCVEMGKWLVWDGKRWAIDEMGTMHQMGKRMARLLYLQGTGNSALEKHARASESFAAITAALKSAATEPGIPISAADLDQQPLLLNCPNGVLDLSKTGGGKLLPHNREVLITKLCPVPYDPQAQCPRFLDFVHWAMGANPDAELGERTVRLVSFLQRAFGYSLTADVSESAVFVGHGGGRNGKSTLLNVFRELLGKDYSGQIVIDTVMSMKNQDATTRADLADLRGVRFVQTSEVEKEHKLSEGKIKYITAGMGNIKSCRKYENPIEFEASHKLWMDCNHRPTVRGVDVGIWRRLKLVPFNATVSEEEKDLHLKDKLAAELPGILAWAVRGCLAWQREGLGDPPEVKEAGQLWREHDDPLKDFLEDCCKVDEGLYARATDLAAGYEWWCQQNRERFPLGREAFNERLLSKGFIQSRSRRIDGKQARTWEGIELLSEVSNAIRNRGSAGGEWLAEQ